MGEDYHSYTVGQVMIETADRLVGEEGQPSVRQFRLLVGALQALTAGTSDGPRPPEVIMDSYLLRAAALAGYAPSLVDCARCGESGPHDAFSPQLGGVVCPACRPPGCARPEPATLAYLGAALSGDWVATRGLSSRTRRQGSGLVAAFMSWHLDRGLRSLQHLDDAGRRPEEVVGGLG